MASSATTPESAAQEERLRAEMKQDAERKAKRIVDRARRDAKKALEEVRREALEQRRVRLTVARHNAEERVSAILAGVEHEKRRRRLLAREEIIGAALAGALRRAEHTEGNERLEILKALLAEAVADFTDDSFTVHCAPADAKLLNETGNALPEGTEAVADESVKNGIVLLFEDGIRRYENTFDARIKRMRERLRTVAYQALSEAEETAQ